MRMKNCKCNFCECTDFLSNYKNDKDGEECFFCGHEWIDHIKSPLGQATSPPSGGVVAPISMPELNGKCNHKWYRSTIDGKWHCQKCGKVREL